MARRFKVRMKRGINIPRVVAKVAGTVLALYVGGTILVEIGNVMVNTSSPFYKGLSLIGWTISDSQNGTASDCGAAQATENAINNCITSTTGSGILAVVGIVGIASIVMEFVTFSL